ncbi:MAG: prolipoprotein diacylglyceryl transferase [Anaerolineales bacterium]|nr:prolipoprotein diacylglyceryl transferase [Anaerolineales bacterium]
MYPILFSIGAWEIHSSIVFLILGILAGVLLGWQESQRMGYSKQNVLTFLVSVVPFALFLGALNGLLFWLGLFDALKNLTSPLSSGLVSFGIILGALFLGWVFALRRRQQVGPVLDLISLTFPLMLGIYRIGCLLNGCCYGLETNSFLGMYLPGYQNEWAYRYPTQIMLIVFNLGLFTWLWTSRKNKSFEGSLTLSFLFWYSLGRLAIDAFRDLPRVLGPFSPHQLASLTILLVTLYIYFDLWHEKRTANR